MSYDAAYLAASMIEHGTAWNIWCELDKTRRGWMIWIYDENGAIIECCHTVDYAMHLFRGKAMI